MMKRPVFLLPVLHSILACGLPQSVTPTNPPPVIATPTSDDLIAVDTPMPTELRDEFEKSLDPGWSWLAEDPANWSLTAVPGSLQITAGRGHVKQDTISNLLLRSAPSGNSFEIETKMTFEPTGNFQFAGLLVYESSSSFLQAGRAYCTSAPCVGDGLYFDLTENNIFVPPNHATRIPATDTVYLRLQRDGGSYSFSYSLDGQTWTAAGEHLSNIVPRFIGLVAGQSESGSRPAVFDYFQWTIQSQDA